MVLGFVGWVIVLVLRVVVFLRPWLGRSVMGEQDGRADGRTDSLLLVKILCRTNTTNPLPPPTWVFSSFFSVPWLPLRPA